MNKETGLISEHKFNEVITVTTKRPNGTLRIQQDFQNCPTMAEQHTAHLTDINYLIKKYAPDELAAYLAARSQHRQEILGHDFSAEPTFQEARNITYQLKQAFDNLSDEIKNNFKNHVEFLKFIDNPANAEKMVKLGLLTKKEIQKLSAPTNDDLNDNKKEPIKESPSKKEPKS